MKISLSWLKSLINIDITTEDLSHQLTMSGLEVEGVEKFESVKGGLQDLVVGEVIEKWQHPNADRLSLTKVNIGQAEWLQIVCGAPNVAKGQKVVVAPVGATIFPLKGEPFKIKKAKIRGELSQGMICAEDEIGLGEDHDGIMILDSHLQPGTAVKDIFELYVDEVIEIGLTPNRGDAASHLGVARELAALMNKAFHPPVYPELKPTGKSGIQVKIENIEHCPRYSGILLTNISVGESPQWLKNRLKSIGLNPLNNVVDTTNYVLHELGQPIHAFDADHINGEIIVRTARKGEKITTLDETERKLEGTELLICDSSKPLAIAGVFGGLHSGVTSSTRSVFIESAYFDPAGIRQTAKKHGLSTDASFRYERGTDPEITIPALQRMVELLQEVAGAEIASDVVDLYPEPLQPYEVVFRWEMFDRISGLDLNKKRVKEILTLLEINIIAEDGKGLILKVPRYRTDVYREIDVIEEVVRIHGLDKIPMMGKLAYTPDGKKNELFELKTDLAIYLRGIGFNEMMNNSLTHEQHYPSDQSVALLNPLSKELGVMRADLIQAALPSVSWNKNRKNRDLRLFEIGKVYKPQSSAAGEEEERLLLISSGNKLDEHWKQPSERSDFYFMKGVVEAVLNRFGKSWSEDMDCTIAPVGKALLDRFDIKDEVFYADLPLRILLRNSDQSSFSLKTVPVFPEVRRDLSLLLDRGITYEQLKQVAWLNGGKYLQKINIFDVFEDKKLGDNKKSYSLSFSLYNKERTMSDKEIDQIMKRLEESFEKELKAEVRR